MKTSVWDSFDKIVCITFAKRPDRRESVTSELERVGMLPDLWLGGKFSFHVTSTSHVNDAIRNAVMQVQAVVPRTVGQFNSTFAQHEVIRSAYDSGAESVLVLEDDVRFLQDAKRVKEIIGSWRASGGDCVLFDRFLHTMNFPLPYVAGGERWVRFDKHVRGTSCYALTRAGMVEFMRVFQEHFVERHKLLMSDEVTDYANCAKVFSAQCACVQKEFDGNLNAVAFGVSQYAVYRANGVPLEEYNL